jgi:hypothetical protein
MRCACHVFWRICVFIFLKTNVSGCSVVFFFFLTFEFAACWEGDARAVDELLRAGCRVEARAQDGLTVVHIAATKGFDRVLQVLLDFHRAKLSGSNATNNVSATAKSQSDQTSVLSAIDLEARVQPSSATALFLAAQEGHSRCVAMLLAAGAQVNAARKGSVTPLYVACQQGHLECVTELLGAGADWRVKTDQGGFALYIASCKGHLAIVKALIRAGASVSELCGHNSVLDIAISEGHFDVAEELLNAGARVHKTYEIEFAKRGKDFAKESEKTPSKTTTTEAKPASAFFAGLLEEEEASALLLKSRKDSDKQRKTRKDSKGSPSVERKTPSPSVEGTKKKQIATDDLEREVQFWKNQALYWQQAAVLIQDKKK